MTTEQDRSHPDEAALIAWLDEPTGPDSGLAGHSGLARHSGLAGHSEIARHLEACETCAGRVESLRAVLDELAAAPAMPEPTLLATRRARILGALAPASDASTRSFPAWRRVAWASALAAAALAALLLWSPAGERPPVSPSADGVARLEPEADAEDPGAGSPVAAAAERTAEAVAAAAASATTGDEDAGGLVLDEAALESLAGIETASASFTDESTYESTLLADEFAALSEEDRATILDELSDLTFEL